MDCIFCKIVKGEIPAVQVYEDDCVLAFLDINPVNFGHTLILPKAHYESLLAVPEDIVQKLAVVVQVVARAVQRAFEYEGFNILLNNGRVAGQEIPHVHFHVMPRVESDNIHVRLSHKEYKESEIGEVAEKIKNAMDSAPDS